MDHFSEEADSKAKFLLLPALSSCDSDVDFPKQTALNCDRPK